jgi:hypothetical protein
VHGEEDGVGAQKGNPEMQLSNLTNFHCSMVDAGLQKFDFQQKSSMMQEAIT